MTKIIVDCGSTKADWALVNEGGTRLIQTVGMNPVHQSLESLTTVISDVATEVDSDSEVFFYGAGCAAGEGTERMKHALSMGFGNSCVVNVYSDMLGAARSLLGSQSGLVCILGTGSNSCYYDGNRIVSNVSPLGYILGDEGSGAVLGKRLVNAIYKCRLGTDVRLLFEQETGLDNATIIRKVYQQPNANRFLGSLSKFVGAHKDEYAGLRQLAIDNFREFITNNLDFYNCKTVNAIGSIAWHFKTELEDACISEGYHLGRVEKSPMNGLIAFHCQ